MVRVGKVTNIYPNEGKVKVMYEDRKEATMPLPVLTFNDEYKMPAVGSSVLVLHLQNGSSKGIVLGTYWNDNNKPAEVGAGVYHKRLGGEAYSRYADSILKIYSPKLQLQCEAGGISIETLVALLERVSELEDRVSKLEAQLGV